MTLFFILLQTMTHPAILTFGQTTQKKFPLIMIVGREPNNSTMSDSTIGNYDFKKYSNCAFWNIAFSLFGHCNSKNTNEIKQTFKNSNCSPIIFTDASPKGIPNIETNKRQFRNTLTHQDFDHQIEVIFNNPLITRVKLIFLSGLTDTNFLYFREQFIKKALSLSIPTTEIAFLFGNNLPKIKTQITDREITIIKNVFQKYSNNEE